jgi:hypothetical protein
LPGGKTTRPTKLGVLGEHDGPAWSPHGTSPVGQNVTGTSGKDANTINGGLGNDVRTIRVCDMVVLLG